MLPALLISRSERSIVRVSIYNSSQPQVICPPAEYLDFPEFNYSSNLLDYNTMATTAAGIQQQQVIGLGAAYDRQQRWVAIIMGTILRKYIIVSWVISSIAAPIPAGTIPFDQAAICPEADEIVNMIRGKYYLIKSIKIKNYSDVRGGGVQHTYIHIFTFLSYKPQLFDLCVIKYPYFQVASPSHPQRSVQLATGAPSMRTTIATAVRRSARV